MRSPPILSLALLVLFVGTACTLSAPKVDIQGKQEAEGETSMTETAQQDPYLWLEEIESERALAWVGKRNANSLAALESDPRFEGFKKRNLEVLTADDRIPYGRYNGRHVYNFWQDEEHVRGILRRTSLSSYRRENPSWETVLDLDELAAQEGENWVYKGMISLAPRHERAMLHLSRGGKDATVEREFDLEKKEFIPTGFRLPEAKSDLDFISQNQLLVGTDFGPGSLTKSGYPRTLRIWERGTDFKAAHQLFEGNPNDVGVFPYVSIRDGRTDVFVVQAVGFFESKILWLAPEKRLLELPFPTHIEFVGAFHGYGLARLDKEWRSPAGVTHKQGSLLAVDLDRLAAGDVRVQSVYAPPAGTFVEDVAFARDRIYVKVLSNVNNHLLTINGPGSDPAKVDLPAGGSISAPIASGDSDLVFVTFENFLIPPKLYVIRQGSVQGEAIKSTPARFDYSPYELSRGSAKSKDGTMVPYFLIAAKDMPRNGRTPVLQYGYGGFRIALTPGLLGPVSSQWLESGGAYVLANIRGGGEFGSAWHQAALQENRQRAYDDFIAVAEDLIATRVTNPRHLGIMGGSNGGLLMGVMLTQRPDLFSAIVCQVPLLDMLRYHKLPPGASWIAEYGDPEIPEERAYIARYSPYQNLRRDASYPRIFFMTSTKDDRVHPGHARKMAARMEEMGHPFLYYENTEGGHGGVANQRQRARVGALQLVYLLRMLSAADHPQN